VRQVGVVLWLIILFAVVAPILVLFALLGWHT
jgi:hypothetical protein